MNHSTYYSTLLAGLLLAAPCSLVRADDASNMYSQETSSNTELLSKYLLNLGAYLGYDLSTSPSSSTPPSTLLAPSDILQAQQSSFTTLLGSIPVNAISSAIMSFVAGTNASYAQLNGLANTTFKTPPYNTPTQDGNVSVSSLVDQKPYQPDPVSQAVLNILGTPDYSYCMTNDGSSWTGGSTGSAATSVAFPDCNYLYGSHIMLNTIGTSNISGTNSVLPGTNDFFNYKYNQQFLSQLNSNTLISPLLYTTTADQSSGSSTQTTQNGLPAQSQAQQAANFIRYATAGVMPLNLPSRKIYDSIYIAATTPSGDPNTPATAAQVQAQSNLAAYLTNLRVYAAQSSVGFGNLYYILSKRLPQPDLSSGANSGSANSKNSQALNEFTMATWRLFNPAKPKNSWLSQINNATSVTVQKEMVTLLAEINYQLYLNRQQEERLLLTNTMLLLQNARSAQPSSDTLNLSNTAPSSGS